MKFKLHQHYQDSALNIYLCFSKSKADSALTMIWCVGLWAYRSHEGILKDNWKNLGLTHFLFVGLRVRLWPAFAMSVWNVWNSFSAEKSVWKKWKNCVVAAKGMCLAFQKKISFSLWLQLQHFLSDPDNLMQIWKHYYSN